MSRISRFVVLLTALASVTGVMSATAGAVTWDVTGSGSFAATSGPGTLSSTGVNLACASGSATGTYAAGSIPGSTYSGVSGSVTFNQCFLAGQAAGVSCTYRLTGTTEIVTKSVTTGNADVTCGVTLAGTKLCHISGSPHAIYTSPTGATTGRLTITSSPLTIGNASPNVCPAGANDTNASLTELTFNVTTGGGPVLHRTA
jgi:hypothetical protein